MWAIASKITTEIKLLQVYIATQCSNVGSGSCGENWVEGVARGCRGTTGGGKGFPIVGLGCLREDWVEGVPRGGIGRTEDGEMFPIADLGSFREDWAGGVARG